MTKTDQLLRSLATSEDGERSWDDLLAQLDTVTQALARMVYRLEEEGLVEPLEWNGTIFQRVRLTEAGRVRAGSKQR